MFNRSKKMIANLIHVIQNSEGGIEKRIDENRELFLTIVTEAPELLMKRPWIKGWLESQEQYLISISKSTNTPIDYSLIRPWHEPENFNIIKITAQTPAKEGKESLIFQLESAIRFLKEGKAKGIEHDDDFGFIFETSEGCKSIFGDEPCAREIE